MENVIVEVTEELIKAGDHSSDNCPVALAIKQKLVGWDEELVHPISVTTAYVDLYLDHSTFTLSNPWPISEWIQNYDSGFLYNTPPSKPFSFEIDFDNAQIVNIKGI